MSKFYQLFTPRIFQMIGLALAALIVWLVSTTLDESVFRFVIDIAVTRYVLLIAGVVLLCFSLWEFGKAFAAGAQNFRWIAWWAAYRQIGAVRLGLSLLLVGVFVLWPDFLGVTLFENEGSILQALLSLLMAVQAAALFAPDDEPALEIQLALKRPLAWLIAERLLVLFLSYGVITLIVIGFALAKDPTTDVWMILVRWLPSALFLSGLGIFLTMRSRLVLFGILLTGLLWGIFLIVGDLLLPGGQFPFPLNLVQPFLWGFNIYASPEMFFESGDFWINRVFLSGAGMTLMVLAIWHVRNEESVLLNLSQKQNRRSTQKSVPVIPLHENTLNSLVKVKPAAIDIQMIRQVFGIGLYELKMHWRRRALKVFLLTLLLVNLFVIFVISETPTGFAPLGDPSGNSALINGFSLIMYAAGPFLTVVIFLFPLMVAEVVPLDKQYGVDEILYALPFSKATYLLGKVLGVLLASLTAFGGAALVLMVGWYLKTGAFSLAVVLNFLVVSFVMLLANSVLTILAGSTQSTRVRALVVGMVALFFVLFAGGQLHETAGNLLFPNQLEMFTFYITGSMASVANASPAFDLSLSSPPVSTVLLGSAIQMAVVSFLIWIYERRA